MASRKRTRRDRTNRGSRRSASSSDSPPSSPSSSRSSHLWDWLFDEPGTSRFIKWLTSTIGPKNVLGPKSLHQYRSLKSPLPLRGAAFAARLSELNISLDGHDGESEKNPKSVNPLANWAHLRSSALRPRIESQVDRRSNRMARRTLRELDRDHSSYLTLLQSKRAVAELVRSLGDEVEKVGLMEDRVSLVQKEISSRLGDVLRGLGLLDRTLRVEEPPGGNDDETLQSLFSSLQRVSRRCTELVRCQQWCIVGSGKQTVPQDDEAEFEGELDLRFDRSVSFRAGGLMELYLDAEGQHAADLRQLAKLLGRCPEIPSEEDLKTERFGIDGMETVSESLVEDEAVSRLQEAILLSRSKLLKTDCHLAHLRGQMEVLNQQLSDGALSELVFQHCMKSRSDSESVRRNGPRQRIDREDSFAGRLDIREDDSPACHDALVEIMSLMKSVLELLRMQTVNELTDLPHAADHSLQAEELLHRHRLECLTWRTGVHVVLKHYADSQIERLCVVLKALNREKRTLSSCGELMKQLDRLVQPEEWWRDDSLDALSLRGDAIAGM